MDFVFMLTRNDATVENALDLVEVARPLAVRHIGFKDVGAEPWLLKRLTAAIREAGASVWMEVVSTTREDELRSIALARDLGVDWLMGGVLADEGLRILKASAVRYLPFAGKPLGHPTRLGGTAAEVEGHCRAFAQKGCAGLVKSHARRSRGTRRREGRPSDGRQRECRRRRCGARRASELTAVLGAAGVSSDELERIAPSIEDLFVAVLTGEEAR